MNICGLLSRKSVMTRPGFLCSLTPPHITVHLGGLSRILGAPAGLPLRGPTHCLCPHLGVSGGSGTQFPLTGKASRQSQEVLSEPSPATECWPSSPHPLLVASAHQRPGSGSVLSCLLFPPAGVPPITPAGLHQTLGCPYWPQPLD